MKCLKHLIRDFSILSVGNIKYYKWKEWYCYGEVCGKHKGIKDSFWESFTIGYSNWALREYYFANKRLSPIQSCNHYKTPKEEVPLPMHLTEDMAGQSHTFIKWTGRKWTQEAWLQCQSPNPSYGLLVSCSVLNTHLQCYLTHCASFPQGLSVLCCYIQLIWTQKT